MRLLFLDGSKGRKVQFRVFPIHRTTSVPGVVKAATLQLWYMELVLLSLLI